MDKSIYTETVVANRDVKAGLNQSCYTTLYMQAFIQEIGSNRTRNIAKWSLLLFLIEASFRWISCQKGRDKCFAEACSA